MAGSVDHFVRKRHGLIPWSKKALAGGQYDAVPHHAVPGGIRMTSHADAFCLAVPIHLIDHGLGLQIRLSRLDDGGIVRLKAIHLVKIEQRKHTTARNKNIVLLIVTLLY